MLLDKENQIALARLKPEAFILTEEPTVVKNDYFNSAGIIP